MSRGRCTASMRSEILRTCWRRLREVSPARRAGTTAARMSAVPQLGPSRAPRRRRRHGGALLAALAYALAGFALYQLVAPSLRDEPAARPEPATAAAPPAHVDLPGVGPREELALRAVASRVQQSVY